MEMKTLTKLIKSIKTRSSTMREDIQTALVGCAYHAMIHRNTAAFNQLFEAVGDGTRKEGMLKWASIYAPVHFKDGEVVLSDKRQKEYDGIAEEYLAELAQSAKWYAIPKPEAIANPWDSVKFAETLALYLENAAKKASKNDSVLEALVKEAAMLFRAKLNAEYDTKEVPAE